jgi:DNA (cytosine-5)-methyltransferase 1
MSKGTTKIQAVDLFCGVGGLTKGLSDAGVDVRLGVDLDPNCKFAYSKNNLASFLEADVLEITSEILISKFDDDAITLLAGCAPCQPFSTYARSLKGPKKNSKHGRGKADDWKLVRKFGELVKETQPDLVTMENVPPLADQPIFEDFLACLQGYSVEYAIIDGRNIGLPQSRRRLVLVASRLGQIKMPMPSKPAKTVREAIGSLPNLKAGQADPGDPLHCASRLSDTNMSRMKASKPGGTWRDWPLELRAACHIRSSGESYPSVYGRMEWDKPSPTITTQCFGYGNGRFGHPDQNRAISLREASMLQGFPRDYAFLDRHKKATFAVLGRLIGNAVPVPLGVYIGEVLRDHVLEMGNSSDDHRLSRRSI